MIATGQMITLRAGCSTLTFFTASQLLEFSVKFFDLPTQLIRFLGNLRGHGLIEVIRDDPVNVAVWGNHLEQFHFEGNLFQLHNNTVFQLFICPINLIQMHITCFFAQTDQTIGFQCCVKSQTQALYTFQVLPGRIPAIKQNGFCLDLLITDRIGQHFNKMIILCFAICFFRVDPIINWIILSILSIGMHQVDNTNPFHQTSHRSTILQFHQFYRSRILLVLHTIVQDQGRFFAIIDQVFNQFPKMPGGQVFSLQVITHRIMANSLNMFSQVRACVVDRCAYQIFYIFLFCDHFTSLPNLPLRKSYVDNVFLADIETLKVEEDRQKNYKNYNGQGETFHFLEPIS